MRALYVWGTLVACLSIVNRNEHEPLAISDERVFEIRDVETLSSENHVSPMKAKKLSARGGGGRGGGSSSGSGGRGGGGEGGGSKGGKGSNGYGKTSRPDHSEDSNPPPPYSKGDNAPPPPYSRGSYGQRGPSSSYWNGQYYPYGAYGYVGFFPFLGVGAAPLLLAGPFGLYGHYCAGSRTGNCTVKNYYVNGTRNDTSSSEINLVNGTYYEILWQDSNYVLRSQEGGVYMNAQLLNTDDNVAVNGTYDSSSSSWETKSINPNVTSNGTTLESSDNSGPASLRTPSIYVGMGAIAVTALLM